ncbi:MAG: methionine--tRNA ligase subunit beta [Candidatus Paceibacterota bacterium]
MISFDDFKKLDLRAGTVTAAEYIEDADKLLLLKISLGDEERQVVSGIRSVVDDPADLVGIQLILVANLEPREIFGYESQGMILAARDVDELSLATFTTPITAGTKVS